MSKSDLTVAVGIALACFGFIGYVLFLNLSNGQPPAGFTQNRVRLPPVPSIKDMVIWTARA